MRVLEIVTDQAILSNFNSKMRVDDKYEYSSIFTDSLGDTREI